MDGLSLTDLGRILEGRTVDERYSKMMEVNLDKSLLSSPLSKVGRPQLQRPKSSTGMRGNVRENGAYAVPRDFDSLDGVRDAAEETASPSRTSRSESLRKAVQSSPHFQFPATPGGSSVNPNSTSKVQSGGEVSAALFPLHSPLRTVGLTSPARTPSGKLRINVPPTPTTSRTLRPSSSSPAVRAPTARGDAVKIVQGSSRDVSFLIDSASNEVDMSTLSTSKHAWQRTTFPSAQPTGRLEAIHLEAYLRQLLSEAGVPEGGSDWCFDASQSHSGALTAWGRLLTTVYDPTIMELSRQITVQCTERGTVLLRIWKAVLSAVHSLVSTAEQDKRNALAALLKSTVPKSALSDLEAKLLAEINALKANIRVLEEGVDGLRSQLKDWQKKHAEALKEIAKLKSEHEADIAALKAAHADALARVQAQLDASLAREKLLKADVAGLANELDFRNMELAHAQAEAAAAVAEAERIRACVPSWVKLDPTPPAPVAKERPRSVTVAMSTPVGLLSARTPIGSRPKFFPLASVDVEHKGTQTDSNELDDGSVDGGDAASGGTSVSKKKFGRRHKLKFTSFSAAYKKGLLRDIQQIYKDKIAADEVDLQVGTPVDTMEEYIVKWFENKYGLEDLAESAMAKFTAGLEFFKADSLYCNTMGRLLFLFEPLTAIHCSTYLSMLAELSAMGSSPADITWSQDGLNVLVDERVGLRFVRSTLPAYATVAQIRSLAATLSASAVKPKLSSRKYIDQELILTHCLNLWSAARESKKQMLEQLFVAADVDQSGTMEYDEFVALVGQVFPQPPSSDEITALFRAACEASGQEDSYSFATLEGFVDAMLNSSAFKYKRHSLATADPASTFDSLSEAWKSEQEGLAALLPALSPEDRAALNVRTSAFMKLLEERTDPTAALVGYDMLKAQLEFLEKRHSVTSADAATL